MFNDKIRTERVEDNSNKFMPCAQIEKQKCAEVIGEARKDRFPAQLEQYKRANAIKRKYVLKV